MPYQTPDDLGVPEHDPIADEQDLLTVLEAAARLHDQLGEARQQLATAESGPDSAPQQRLDALHDRIEVLERGLERYDRLRRERAAGH
ncbi:hypothetical protein [Pseudonocardia pini]|uniref:hypothetical protein n=1 Tax=Pseudonocardia pini TaxID=2758030 RepID=UPI0015F01534|nr:hypothetical protein [Pseudonocardia pini]